MQASPAFDALLRHARRAAGLTQEQLADRAGLSARVISDIERGVIRSPRPDTLDLLVAALGLDETEHAQWRATRARLARHAPPAPAAPPITRSGHRSTLPQPLTPLVGRERDADRAFDVLQHPVTRLLTMTGPGGIGKTRLALEVSRIVQADGVMDVTFVDLSPVLDPANVLSAIASVLGVTESASRSLLEDLILARRSDRVLLVLDNVEQVVDAAGEIAHVLVACPEVTILATSRVPLHIQGEQLFPVASLTLPDRETKIDHDGWTEYEAIVLFEQRARAANPEFRITPENVQQIAEICSRLDGLPLAIELAASRVLALSPRAILERYNESLRFLTGGGLDLPARQRTLRDTIQWSYDLLEANEQELLRQLSVFSGGWTLEAAESVVAVDASSGADVIDGLIALRAKNLLTTLADAVGEPRFGMLETIHEFAWHEFAMSGHADTVRDCHADYFLQLAEASNARTDRSDDNVWIDRLDREQGNLRAAIAWLRQSNDVVRGLRLVGALGWFWFTLGILTEGREQIRWFLDLPGAEQPTIARALALTKFAWLAVWLNDVADAYQASKDALAICQGLGVRDAVPDTLVILGIAAHEMGDLELAQSIWAECVPLAQSVGDRLSQTLATINLASIATDAGRTDEAMTLLQESLVVSTEHGIHTSTALALSNLSDLAVRRGDITYGEQLVKQALSLYDTVRETWGIGACLLSLGSIAASDGRPVRATRLIAAAMTLERRIVLTFSRMIVGETDRELASLRTMLGEEFQRHWELGSALTLAEAVAEALSDDDL